MRANGTTLVWALLALVLAAPVMLVVAIAIRTLLGAPVLFRQQRSGQSGRPFTLVKFRTMTDVRDADGALLPDAQRTPWLGRFLRRSRLDELPELWNILRGEMAFFGPRPLLPETITVMGEGGRRRGWLLPGLTGWAQVNGNSLLGAEEKLALDLWYVDHHSARLNAVILLKTLGVIAWGERRASAPASNSPVSNSPASNSPARSVAVAGVPKVEERHARYRHRGS